MLVVSLICGAKPDETAIIIVAAAAIATVQDLNRSMIL